MIRLSNKLTAALLAVSIVSASSIASAAADEHAAHHPMTDAKGTTDSASAPTPAPNDAMSNMKKMQEQMAAIRASKDPKERAKLLDEHLQTMQSTMSAMQRDTRCTMRDGGAMKGGESGGGMNMMQMMMEQMMQHQKAMEGSAR